MLDAGINTILSILGISFGGVSVAGLIGLGIGFLKSRHSDKKQASITKTSIEEGFKSAVLPQKIKLDISEKIEKPIQEAMTKLTQLVEDSIKKMDEDLILILKILNEFTHVKKLSEEDQEKIAEIISNIIVEEVKI